MKQPAQFIGAAKKIRRELLKSLSRVLRVGPVRTRIEGKVVKIPLVYGLGADHLSRTTRPWTYDIVERLVDSRPGHFIDIGANVGLYLIWLKSMDETRPYLGFEPNPACCFYLQELIRCNDFAESSVFPIALAATRRQRTFFARRIGDKMGSLLADHRIEKEKPHSFAVLTQPGDPVFEDLNLTAICAMKIDVEGSELQVLRGLAGTLKRYRPTLICEVLNPKPEQPSFTDRVESMDALLRLARELDYRVLSRGDDGRMHIADTSEDLRAHSSSDRILVPVTDLDHVLALGKDAKQALPQPVDDGSRAGRSSRPPRAESQA